jgi:hypothetical protein
MSTESTTTFTLEAKMNALSPKLIANRMQKMASNGSYKKMTITAPRFLMVHWS